MSHFNPFYPPKWQISRPFHKPQIAKSLPFHIPAETWKRYPYRAEPPRKGIMGIIPPGVTTQTWEAKASARRKKIVFHFFFLSQIQENVRECQNGRRQTKSISEQEGGSGEERREFRMPCNSIFDWSFVVPFLLVAVFRVANWMTLSV